MGLIPKSKKLCPWVPVSTRWLSATPASPGVYGGQGSALVAGCHQRHEPALRPATPPLRVPSGDREGTPVTGPGSDGVDSPSRRPAQNLGFNYGRAGRHGKAGESSGQASSFFPSLFNSVSSPHLSSCIEENMKLPG